MKLDVKMILDKIMNYKGFKTKVEFANFLGVKPNTLSNWYSRNSLDADLISEKIPEISKPFLLAGVGEIVLEEHTESDESRYNDDDPEIKNEYLKKAFERLGKQQNEIVEDLGKSQSYISELMNGKRNAGRKIARELADRYGFDYDSILSGRDISEIKAKTYIEKRGSAKLSMQREVGRPFYDVDFTLGFEGVDNDITLHPEFNIDFPPANREGVNWFRGKGNSMLGDINSGDFVALEEIEDFSWFPLGRIYGVVTKNGFRTIKRIVKSENKNEYMLVSSNPDKVNYPDQTLPKEMLHKLYKVVFIIKDLDE